MGTRVGLNEACGCAVGIEVGSRVGVFVGVAVGAGVGMPVGAGVGASVGAGVGQLSICTTPHDVGAHKGWASYIWRPPQQAEERPTPHSSQSKRHLLAQENQRIGIGGLVVSSHQEGMLKDLCQAGVLLENGNATWFDDINDAIKQYHESLGK